MNTISTATLVTLVLAVSLVPMGLTANALSGQESSSKGRRPMRTDISRSIFHQANMR
jgi:hypothetical protein